MALTGPTVGLGTLCPWSSQPPSGTTPRTPAPRRPRRSTLPRRTTGPQVDIAIPVYNEEADLEASVRRLHAYLSAALPFSFRITVADNASTDRTWAIARPWSDELPGVRRRAPRRQGTGTGPSPRVVARATRPCSPTWTSTSPPTSPRCSPWWRRSCRATATWPSAPAWRTASRVVRGTKREVISRCYNLLLRTTLAAGFSDAQCGFKAIRADRARTLLPLVKDTGWFFDTELLFLAERAGMRIHEVPVDWVDDPDSRVDLVATAVARPEGRGPAGARASPRARSPSARCRESTRAEQAVQARPGLFAQLARFCVVGVLSTAAYVVLYVVLRTGMPAQGANALALLATAVANTAVNRRVTFGVRSRTVASPPPAAGHRRLRRGPGAHQRRAGGAAPRRARTRDVASRSRSWSPPA